MGKDKSILEKITGTMKEIANIAADAADHAMKANEPPPKAVERSAAYIPLVADGLVSDPMMVPPIAAVHAPRRKRAARKQAAKARTRSNRTVGKSHGKVAKKSTVRRSRNAAKSTAARKTNKKAAKKSAKKARYGRAGTSFPIKRSSHWLGSPIHRLRPFPMAELFTKS
jgi:hypothetical protein